jgi:cytochrome P450
MMQLLEQSLERRVQLLFAGDPEMLADPFPTWDELRMERPVWRHGDTVVLSRHADVKELLGDNHRWYSRQRTRTSARYEDARGRFSAPGREAYDRVMDHEFGQLVRMDPPDHPRVRRVVMPPFSARSLAREMEGKVHERVRTSLDELGLHGGDVDFKRFAYTLPLQVLGDLLGIPLDDLDQVHGWAHAIAENKLNAESESKAVEADAAYESLMGYIERLVRRQRASGETTGLVAALLVAEEAGQVTTVEAREMLALMIFAGHETTSNLLAVGLLALLKEPAQWERLCADPALAPSAVEELLRFVSPAQFLQYVVAQDRVIDDVELWDGDTVIGVLASANRDPDVFADPGTLDITRTDSRGHVSLGLGPHFCLGAGLARMEGTALFAGLAERFPGIRLVSEDLTWGGRSLRTPIEMPVTVSG